MPIPAPGPRRRDGRPLLLLLIVTAFVFGRAIGFDFVYWDDSMTVHENPHFNPPGWDGIAYYWTHVAWNVYMPVTTTVWGLTAMAAHVPTGDPAVPSLNPYLFHTLNVVAHLCAAYFVFRILAELRFKPWGCCAGALVFAVHPLQVEPVAWVSALNVPLSGALSFLAILLYLRAARATRPTLARGRYVGATIAFVLALLAKPTAATAPLIVAVIDVLLLGRPWRTVLRWVGPWVALAACLAVITSRWQTYLVEPMAAPAVRPFIAADVLAFYLRKLVVPLNLGIDYGRSPDVVLRSQATTWTVLATLLITATLWLFRREARPLWAAYGLFIAGLAANLGLLEFDFQAYSTAADRYAYHAMIGAAVAIAWLASRVRPPAAIAALLTVVIAALATLTWRQVGHWRDTPSLFAQALAVNPRSWLAHYEYANSMFQAERYRESIWHFRQAIAYRGSLREQELFQLAVALDLTGDAEGAFRQYRRTLRIAPRSIKANLYLGGLLAQFGQRDLAEAHFRAVLELDPNNKAAAEAIRALPTTQSANPD